MSDAKKPKRRCFWSKVEAAGDGMEFGLRCLFGIFFAVLFCAGAYSIGAYVWSGLGFVLALVATPVGFVVGFFWVEVKFLIGLILGFFFHP
jgi:hypothetical protein